MNSNGRFLGSIHGESRSNVILRKEQYRISDDETKSLEYAQHFIISKLYNSKWVLERACRDHALQVDVDSLKISCGEIKKYLLGVKETTNLAELRGIEGKSAAQYFGEFDQLIPQNKTDFSFTTRNRRPPLDPVNILLSFTYSLLTSECRSALEAVGLDAYVGFFHQNRSGSASLALDLIEELRSVVADRFVLSN
ncbi:hypothetical protein FACS1894132_11240 [Clostridia bacterium]|nr:hypothetical protein FACS1894132_11240 [Clostridia bacterium]